LEIRRDILWRVYLGFLCIILLSFIILGRAFYIQRFEGNHWRSMSDSMHRRYVNLEAERGTLYSSDRQMLSTSLPQFNIYIDFMAEGLRAGNGKVFHDNLDEFTHALAKFFSDKPAAVYKKELLKAYHEKQRYYPLKKKLSFEQYKEFREFPLVKLGRNKSGVIAEVKTIRKNPYELLARRTIGLYRENAQMVGLERTYDSVLKGQAGKRLVRFSTGGVALPVEGYEIEPENGHDVITNIDITIQDIVNTALMKMMQKSEARYGTCIVMETKTGKIKAIANLGRKPDGSYDEDYNYALLTTEPGSTIKLATLLSVLSEGKITLNDSVKVGSAGKDFVGVRNVNDAERSPRPLLSVKECFSHSSNVGMSKIAYQSFASQPDKYIQYLRRFRLDTLTGIDIMGEDKPRIPKIRRNNEGLHAMVTMSFGYAIEVSPLQTLNLYNAVANDGVMMKPYLVSSIESNGIITEEFTPVVLEKDFCNPEVIKAAKQSMEAVTTEGTARKIFKDLPFKVAGKTGTAHVADGRIKYNHGVYQASFVGYFPADEPKYSCIVVIRTKPHSALHYGGQLAAPVFKEIASRLYAMYIDKKTVSYAAANNSSQAGFYAGNSSDIKNVFSKLNMNLVDSGMQNNWAAVTAMNNNAVLKANPVSELMMPDLKGMGLKDAVWLLENMGLRVQVKGKGKIVSQSIEPGTALAKGMTVVVELMQKG
jgi:cell division protein FtsI (penicillin-binding protein 3)